MMVYMTALLTCAHTYLPSDTLVYWGTEAAESAIAFAGEAHSLDSVHSHM